MWGEGMIRDVLNRLEALERAIEDAHEEERESLVLEHAALLEQCRSLAAEDRVVLARHPRRPKIDGYVNALFTDFFEHRGDRSCREDRSMLCGIALFHGRPVTVIGHRKGSSIEENMRYNFGMPGPEGFRKALRAMQQAEKFHRPVITFIDTPGAYPGMEAEERGQGEAIAHNLAAMSRLRVPVVSIVTGEGNSGGALAIGVANRVLMLENAYYAVLSPEGFASILWKDASRKGEACDVMKLTAQDLFALGVIEEIVPEALGGAQRDVPALMRTLDAALSRALDALSPMDADALVAQRYDRFRKIGQIEEMK